MLRVMVRVTLGDRWLSRSYLPVPIGAKSQNSQAQPCRGKRKQGVGQAQGRGQGARDIGHLCGPGFYASIPRAVKFPSRK